MVLNNKLDASVLENFHIAQAFKLLMIEENNFFCYIKKEEFNLVRSRIIESILSTDIKRHQYVLGQLRDLIKSYEISYESKGRNLEKIIFPENLTKSYNHQQIVLNTCIHAADISNPAKPSSIYTMWVDLLFVELFNQGDIEKSQNLPISPLCNRETVSISVSQCSFIHLIVQPTFSELINVIPNIYTYYEVIKSNYKRYYERVVKEGLI